MVAGLLSLLLSHSLIYKVLDIVQQEIRSYCENHHKLPEKILALSHNVV